MTARAERAPSVMNRADLALLFVVLAALTFIGWQRNQRERARRASHATERVATKVLPPPTAAESAAAPPVREQVYHVVDETGFLPQRFAWSLDYQLQEAFDNLGVDMRFVVVRGVPDGDLSGYALKKARALGMGWTVDRQALLFLYDVKNERMRIEVGPGMEGVFPDGFVGYLMRDEMATFFAARNPVLGIKYTMWSVFHRLQQAALGLEYDPLADTFITDRTRLAAGAGATAQTTLGATRYDLPTRPATESELAFYRPQPTVEEAHARYLSWLREGQYPTGTTLFTKTSGMVFRVWPMTHLSGDAMLLSEIGQKYKVVVRGDMAILYFTTTPLVAAHFFRHAPEGWQIDISADNADTRDYVDGRYTWSVLANNDDYSKTFADLYESFDGRLRPRDGDNRPLPNDRRLLHR
jgi:uncharacterized protein